MKNRLRPYTAISAEDIYRYACIIGWRVTEEEERHYLNECIGIFQLKEVHLSNLRDKEGEALTALSENVKKRRYDYLAWVTVNEKRLKRPAREPKIGNEIKVFTSRQVAIDFGHDRAALKPFLEKWPAENKYLGIGIILGAVCRFAFITKWLWVIPRAVDHYALCFDVHAELGPDGLVVPDALKPVLRGEMPDVRELAETALARFMQSAGIEYKSIFPFPASEPKIWRPGRRR